MGLFKWILFAVLFIIVTVVGTIVYLLKTKGITQLLTNTLLEGFSDDAAQRPVRYGDKLTLWSSEHSTFIKVQPSSAQNALPVLSQTDALVSPVEFSGDRACVFELRDPAFPDSTRTVMSGDTVALIGTGHKTVTYDKVNLTLVDLIDPSATYKFIVSSIDNSAGKPVAYGQQIRFVTGAKSMLTPQFQMVTLLNDIQMSKITIYDSIGDGSEVNWARRSMATQSSTANGNDARKAIDSNPATYSETNVQMDPWLKITFPGKVFVTKVIVVNALNATDTAKMAMSDIRMTLLDEGQSSVLSKQFVTKTPLDSFPWNNISQIASSLKVELGDDVLSQPGKLMVSKIVVYGQMVEDSVLLDRPLVSDVTSSSVADTLALGGSKYKFNTEDLVPIRDELTIAFWIALDVNYNTTTGLVPLLVRGTDSLADTNVIKCPGIWISATTPTLRVMVSTSKDINDGIQLSSVGLSTEQPSHLAVVIAGAVMPGQNGWRLGMLMSSPTQEMVLYNPLKRFYYSMPGIDASNYTVTFGSATVTPLDDLVELGYQNIGSFIASLMKPQVKLYINGVQSDSKILNGVPITNLGILQLNPEGKVNGSVANLKIANYPMPDQEIKRLAASNQVPPSLVKSAPVPALPSPGQVLSSMQQSGMTKLNAVNAMKNSTLTLSPYTDGLYSVLHSI